MEPQRFHKSLVITKLNQIKIGLLTVKTQRLKFIESLLGKKYTSNSLFNISSYLMMKDLRGSSFDKLVTVEYWNEKIQHVEDLIDYLTASMQDFVDISFSTYSEIVEIEREVGKYINPKELEENYIFKLKMKYKNLEV
jgi:hypothetical protein